MKKVLIIDDDRDIVSSIAYALERHQFNVATAYDGNEGLAIAQTKIPDLIILDLMMPERSGFLTLEYLRTKTELYCPVIVVTGNDGSRHRQYAELLGVAGYLNKPFKIDELVSRVLELLEPSESKVSMG